MALETHPPSGYGGPERDKHDFARLRHARDRDLGFQLGQFIQTPPMLFTRDGHNVFLGDMYRGHTAFLICGGPSLRQMDLSHLQNRGMLTMAVNNAATVCRPQLWCSVDDPGNFSDAIWYDPGMLKFVPLCHMEKFFMERDEQGELVRSAHRVGDMPAVFGFRRNEAFNAEQWLYEDTVNWGNHSNRVDDYGNKGSRSVMYAALRVLFFLGVRRVFLLGCDFRMEFGQKNYAFEQERTQASVRGNNSTYRILNDRLRHLKPHFEQAGFHVYNSTPDSGLTVFPYVPYKEAVELASSIMPEQILTAGMYDREQKQRDAKKEARKGTASLTRPDTLVADETVAEPASQQVEMTACPKCGDQPVTRPLDEILGDLTLLLAIDAEHLEELRLVWPTWMQFRPELRDIPVVVCVDDDNSPGEAELRSVLNHDRLNLIPWTLDGAESQRERMLTAFVHGAAQHVRTRWYLKLDTDVVAVRNGKWVEPDWFAPDETGREPAFVASPWGYTKPADAMERLDRWGATVPALASRPPLNLPYDIRQDRLRHPRIISWCFFGNTQWTRSVAAWSPGRLPVPSHDTWLFYCAARKGDHFVRARMGRYGWEHISSRRRLRRRCVDVLNEIDNK